METKKIKFDGTKETAEKIIKEVEKYFEVESDIDRETVCISFECDESFCDLNLCTNDILLYNDMWDIPFKVEKHIKVDASKPLSNWGGMAVQLSEDGESIRYQYYDNEPSDWVEVQFGIENEDLNEDGESRSYFVGDHDTKYYLDEFMLSNYPN